MEFKSVVGWRRSIRFFDPWREVEREKIQAILEAIYRAPRVLEIDFVRVVVVHRDRLMAEQMATLKTPTTTAQLDMAPTYLFFYADMDALERAVTGDTYRDLMRVGVLNRSHGWSDEFVMQTAIRTSRRSSTIRKRPNWSPGVDGAPRTAIARRSAGRTARACQNMQSLLL